MSDRVHAPTETWSATLALRVALFAVAASLALYIPYKYVTHLHAIEGLYAFLFPLSGVLALAGIVLAVKPQTGCGCSEPMRAGVGVVAGLWMGTAFSAFRRSPRRFRHLPWAGCSRRFTC